MFVAIQPSWFWNYKKDIENEIQCKFYAPELHCIIILEILKKKSRQFEIREQKYESMIPQTNKKKWNEKLSCSEEHDRKTIKKNSSC